MKSDGNKIEKTIVDKAKALGASLAGIASVKDLKASKSYEVYSKSPFYEEYDRESPNYFEFKGVQWRRRAQIGTGVGFGPSSIRACTRLVEHEGTGLYPRQQSDEAAVETAPCLAG